MDNARLTLRCKRSPGRRQTLAGGLCLIAILLASAAPQDGAPAAGQSTPGTPDPAGPETATTKRASRLVTIQLPIRDGEDQRVRRQLGQILARVEDTPQRPLVIFEFQTKGDDRGTSRFGPAYDLADFLVSGELSRIQTVAYLPGRVTGHAVLPVLACEQIIMAPDAELGAAGEGADRIRPTWTTAYEEVAALKATVPVPIALSMLDRSLTVYRVQGAGGVRYVLEQDLEPLRGGATKVEQVVRAGEFGLFTGRKLRIQFGIVSHLAENQIELATKLNLSPGSLNSAAETDGQWKGIRFDIRGILTNARSLEVVRGIRDELGEWDVNLICFVIDSPGGSPLAVAQLASEINAIDSSEIRTVAFVDGQARSTSSLIAMVCDDLVMSNDATLGGPGDPFIPNDDLDSLHVTIQKIMKQKGRDWSLAAALVDKRIKIERFSRGGENRFLSVEERDSFDNQFTWPSAGLVQTAKGLKTREALSLGIARHAVAKIGDLEEVYGLEQPLYKVKRSPLIVAVERLAAEPWFARTLLFIAFFTLMSETSAPGMGVAGFISGLCFLLFFWTQFLSGNAGWLEVVLFVGGVFCVILEIFVIPGVGIFGIGGGLMVITSIVLASQTFVLPRTAYQYDLLPRSIFMAVWSLGGSLTALFVMRRYLPNAPILRRLMLQPPHAEQEDLAERESLVSLGHLLGKQGMTTTQLTPSGKALFDDTRVDVISSGDVIERGTAVLVVEVHGNRVIVEPIEDSTLRL